MNNEDNNSSPRSEAGLELNLLRAVLNQVDYGLAVIVTDTRQVLFVNSPALAALHPDNPQKTGLCVTGGQMCVRQRADGEQFNLALQRTKVGQRGLLHLSDNARDAGPTRDASVAVMPLSTPGYALLAFAKQQMCDTTTVTLFARERGLTNAEGQVLAQICKGLRPQQIATRQGVQVSTVRTQLRAIRQKTASDSVRELVEKVSVMPPLALNLPHFLGSMATHSGQGLVLS
jgi:DNA-binding CsgD family transcriptional regulator